MNFCKTHTRYKNNYAYITLYIYLCTKKVLVNQIHSLRPMGLSLYIWQALGLKKYQKCDLKEWNLGNGVKYYPLSITRNMLLIGVFTKLIPVVIASI